MKIRYIPSTILALALMITTGCQKEDFREVQPSREQITLDPQIGSYTKVSGNNFNDGDSFGLYIAEWNGENEPDLNGGFYADNILCTKKEGGIEMSRIYYPENRIDMYGYYPYSGSSISMSNPEVIPHSIQRDQSIKAMYEQSDFLMASNKGVTASDQSVQMTFEHILCLMDIQLIPGKGMTAADLDGAKLKANKFPGSCNIKLEDRSVNVSMFNQMDITPYGNGVSVTDDKASLMSFIALPGTHNAGKELFTITIKNTDFNYVLDKDLKLESGYRYRFDITLNKSEVKSDIRKYPISQTAYEESAN